MSISTFGANDISSSQPLFYPTPHRSLTTLPRTQSISTPFCSAVTPSLCQLSVKMSNWTAVASDLFSLQRPPPTTPNGSSFTTLHPMDDAGGLRRLERTGGKEVVHWEEWVQDDTLPEPGAKQKGPLSKPRDGCRGPGSSSAPTLALSTDSNVYRRQFVTSHSQSASTACRILHQSSAFPQTWFHRRRRVTAGQHHQQRRTRSMTTLLTAAFPCSSSTKVDSRASWRWDVAVVDIEVEHHRLAASLPI